MKYNKNADSLLFLLLFTGLHPGLSLGTAHPGIHKVFNSTFLSALLKLNVWECVDAFALKVWLNGWCFASVLL